MSGVVVLLFLFGCFVLVCFLFHRFFSSVVLFHRLFIFVSPITFPLPASPPLPPLPPLPPATPPSVARASISSTPRLTPSLSSIEMLLAMVLPRSRSRRTLTIFSPRLQRSRLLSLPPLSPRTSSHNSHSPSSPPTVLFNSLSHLLSRPSFLTTTRHASSPSSHHTLLRSGRPQ